MIELEKTYLAKSLPKDLEKCKFKEIIDIYIPNSINHPKLRIRKSGNSFEITKKESLNDGDAGNQKEYTIPISKIEFETFTKINVQKIRKVRYFYKHHGELAEFDIFQDKLKGLVLVDFEFNQIESKNKFKAPDFCLADVTQEDFIAGGMLCGRTYQDIQKELDIFDYKKIYL